MDGNNNYQGNDYQNQNGDYSNNSYQNQDGGYSNNSYQNGSYPNNGYQNNTYQNPNYGNYQPYQQVYPTANGDMEEPMSVGEWMITLLLMMIPCVNIIMLFVWAFSKTEKKSKSNFCKAELIFMGIILALYLVLIIVMVAAGVSLMDF